MQLCWVEVAKLRPHFHNLVTTISNTLESIAGYLGLQQSVSLIERVKQDYARNPEMPNLGGEEEQMDGNERAEGCMNTECGGEGAIEKEKETSIESHVNWGEC